MKQCELGHDYLIECEICKAMDQILQTPTYKKIENILYEYLKTGNKSVLERLSNGA